MLCAFTGVEINSVCSWIHFFSHDTHLQTETPKKREQNESRLRFQLKWGDNNTTFRIPTAASVSTSLLTIPIRPPSNRPLHIHLGAGIICRQDKKMEDLLPRLLLLLHFLRIELSGSTLDVGGW